MTNGVSLRTRRSILLKGANDMTITDADIKIMRQFLKVHLTHEAVDDWDNETILKEAIAYMYWNS
jgi:hypothetical protein